MSAPQYAAYTGRAVSTYSYEWYDTKRNALIRTTRTHIDVGRADPLTPDPDSTIAYEGPKGIGFRPSKHGKTAELIAEVRELLARRPLNCTEIAAATGNGRNRIQKLFINNPQGFVVVLRGINGNVWALEGVTYSEAIYNGAMGRIVDYLREHGPATAPNICAALGFVYDTFSNARTSNPGVLFLVGKVATTHSNNRLIQVWDVCDEHKRK